MIPASHAQSCVCPVDVCTCLCKSVSVHLRVCTCINASVRLHTQTWGTCAHMQACVYALVLVHTQVCVCICMCICAHVCTHPCAHIHVSLCGHTCACTGLGVHMHMHMRAFTYTHMCTCAHTSLHVHVHIHAPECSSLGGCGAIIECPRPLGTMPSSDPVGRIPPASRSLHANLNSVLDLLLDRVSEC